MKRLQGPILVLGASGFIGAALFRALNSVRSDVYGTTRRKPVWRLEGCAEERILESDQLIDSNRQALLDEIRPRTIFDCIAYGAYSFETDEKLIYQTNFLRATRLLADLHNRGIAMYVHAGSSSEYGAESAGPQESQATAPNSHYSVSKSAVAGLIHYYGRHLKFPCVNLRLYSVYGPLEDASRLIPTVVRRGLSGEYPEFVSPSISRDFVYIDDVVEAFVDVALGLDASHYGQSFNIGSGVKTTIADVAKTAQEQFSLPGNPAYTMPDRGWDVAEWYSNPERASAAFGWKSRTPFTKGLAKTVDWYRAIPDKARYETVSKIHGLDIVYSITAIIACYKDGQAIPIMYDRLTAVFTKLNIDYEIIFVNDCSPDDSEEVIRKLSTNDRRVIGISHSRNFGSQAAFVSGMRIATKNACVLLDGDLQDPPELIEQFLGKWKEGFDVVYGRRVKREATLFMQFAYKAFYRVFDRLSYIPVPHDAGDFSLMDRRVVEAILSFSERDLFLRGVRAFVGFRQTGVDYVRPERMFGVTTNSLWKNFGWAKKGILSFSRVPLHALSVTGIVLFILSLALMFVEVIAKLFFPQLAPPGITTVLLAIMFYGSLSLMGLGIIGEYISKIFDEVKLRPLYIRRSIIREGTVRPANEFALHSHDSKGGR